MFALSLSCDVIPEEEEEKKSVLTCMFTSDFDHLTRRDIIR